MLSAARPDLYEATAQVLVRAFQPFNSTVTQPADLITEQQLVTSPPVAQRAALCRGSASYE